MVYPVERLLGRAMSMVVGPATNGRVQQADQQRLVEGFVRVDDFPEFSKNASTAERSIRIEFSWLCLEPCTPVNVEPIFWHAGANKNQYTKKPATPEVTSAKLDEMIEALRCSDQDRVRFKANPEVAFGNWRVFPMRFARVSSDMPFREVDILLVEDNPDDEFLVLRALRKHKVSNKVHVVRDGEEALDFLFCRGNYEHENCGGNLKLILLDVKLPKVSGLEVLAEIKKDPRTMTIPTVLLTSSNLQEEMLRAYVDGANSFLQKPVDFDHFDELIRHVGYYWMRLNQKPDAITLVAEEPGESGDAEEQVAEPVH